MFFLRVSCANGPSMPFLTSDESRHKLRWDALWETSVEEVANGPLVTVLSDTSARTTLCFPTAAPICSLQVVVPAVMAIAAGAVAVGVATQISSAMTQRKPAEEDADLDADSASPSGASAASGRKRSSGSSADASKEIVDIEADLVAEELRAFDERLLGPDASRWCDLLRVPSPPPPAPSAFDGTVVSRACARRGCVRLTSRMDAGRYARSAGEVGVWLGKAGFGAYAGQFASQDVDGRVLLSLGALAAVQAASRPTTHRPAMRLAPFANEEKPQKVRHICFAWPNHSCSSELTAWASFARRLFMCIDAFLPIW